MLGVSFWDLSIFIARERFIGILNLKIWCFRKMDISGLQILGLPGRGRRVILKRPVVLLDTWLLKLFVA